jgi:hypothetical protein
MEEKRLARSLGFLFLMILITAFAPAVTLEKSFDPAEPNREANPDVPQD